MVELETRDQKLEIDIILYEDFRLFLDDYIRNKKQILSSFSLNRFAKEIAVSPSLLKMVANGQRKMSMALQLKIIKYMQFSSRQRDYFTALVQANQTNNPEEKLYFQSIMRRLKENHMTREHQSSASGMLHKWYFPSMILYIIDVLKIENIVFDHELFVCLKKKFPINEEDFESLKSIFSDPAINAMDNNSKTHLYFSHFGKKIARKQYLKQLLKANLEYQDKSYIHSCAFSISESDYQNCIDDLESVLKKYIAKDFDQKSKVKIVQSTIQFISIN